MEKWREEAVQDLTGTLPSFLLKEGSTKLVSVVRPIGYVAVLHARRYLHDLSE